MLRPFGAAGGSPLIRTIVVTFCLVATFAPLTLASEEPTMPAWLAESLAARGIHVDASDLVVTRFHTENGLRQASMISLADLPAEIPQPSVAPAPVPEVVAGDLLFHLFLDAGCRGYNFETVADGISLSQGAAWDVGFHIVLQPTGTGMGISTAADPTAPISAFEDTGMTVAAGSIVADETYITFFGFCLLSFGTMSGTGAWQFN